MLTNYRFGQKQYFVVSFKSVIIDDVRIVFVVQVVLTKVDKCGHRALLTNLLDLQEVINKHTTSCFPQPFLVR